MTTPAFIAALAAAGAQAPSADNGQPGRLQWDGRALALDYAPRHATTNVFSAHSHATLLAIGAVAENIQAALAANGVDAEWRWRGAGQLPYGTIEVPLLPQTFTMPEGVMRRHTNRLAYRAGPLPGELVARLNGSVEGANRVALLLDAPARASLVGLVRASSEARFCNRDLHRWLFGSLRHTPQEVAAGDGLDMDSLGLPPGGRAMMGLMADWDRMAWLNRLGAYKLLARSEVGLLGAAPALLCIAGAADSASVIDAGRLLTRVWTELNMAGIAVQPYYVVTDQLNRLHEGTLAAGFDGAIGAVGEDVQRLLGLAPGEMLHMILRVGYPKKAPVRSRRLPLDAVFTDASAP